MLELLESESCCSKRLKFTSRHSGDKLGMGERDGSSGRGVKKLRLKRASKRFTEGEGTLFIPDVGIEDTGIIGERESKLDLDDNEDEEEEDFPFISGDKRGANRLGEEEGVKVNGEIESKMDLDKDDEDEDDEDDSGVDGN